MTSDTSELLRALSMPSPTPTTAITHCGEGTISWFHECLCDHQNCTLGTSLVAQWLRIRLPMQGIRVRALVREDPTCHGATKPVHHNY